MVRLRTTFVLQYEYDANPEDYGVTDPYDMAEIDATNWKNDPMIILDMAYENGHIPTIIVEPV